MTYFTHQKHIRFDSVTHDKYRQIIERLWKEKNLPREPKDSEGHRLIVHELYALMFPDKPEVPEVDFSSVNI